MYYFKPIIILFLSINISPVLLQSGVPDGGKVTGGCIEMLETFATYSANFTYCAISHARPIRLCTACVSFYSTLTEVYHEILSYPDSDGQCRDELFNLDRLQVVVSGFRYVTDLWQRASCDSCFKVNPSTGTVPELTDVAVQLFNQTDALYACINKYKNSTACESCKDDYTKLNTIYRNLKADSGEIAYCMDIVDMMNSTRSDWSKKMGCSIEKRKLEYIFWISSSVLSILPVLFYLFVYVFTSKKIHPIIEQNRWQQGTSQSETEPLVG